MRFLPLFSVLGIFFFSFVSPVQAQTATHTTVIINQVRGPECCSPGGVGELEQMVRWSKEHQLPMTFTVRYDALLDKQYQSLLKRAAAQGNEIGAFLEITPQLASDSGVIYHGSLEKWYEAQTVYPLGYSPEDRRKLLDTYLKQFHQVFGTYPKTTTAWIIDSPSLQYLHQTYGITTHQLTREQWGTDSYTLYGGPPHFPYHPSPNWALVPLASASGQMPLIVRQTITDPVNNYGDSTNSYTSQPNDYALAKRNLDYFTHLFNQAHNQLTTNTFALVGLENSMPSTDQQEYGRQLAHIANWRQQSPNNQVLTAQMYADQFPAEPPYPQIYHGNDYELGSRSQAWWITTPNYRARLRYDQGQLFLSDLRLYHPELTDPYLNTTAQKQGYWVIPYTLDGSRFWHGDASSDPQTLYRDTLSNRDPQYAEPTRLVLSSKIDPETLQVVSDNDRAIRVMLGETPIAKFLSDRFLTYQNFEEKLDHPWQKELVYLYQWRNSAKRAAWGWHIQPDGQEKIWRSFFSTFDLATEREERYPFLFPEVRVRPIDQTKSSVVANNRYAQANRNPVRLVFRPRDIYGFPAQIDIEPTISIEQSTASVSANLVTQDGTAGYLFIDLTSEVPQQVKVKVNFHELSTTQTVYFAPDCTANAAYCLKHPRQSFWFVRNYLGDKYRQWQEQRSSIKVKK